MKITVCDRCKLRVEEGTITFKIATDVIETNTFFGNLASGGVKELCPDCDKTVKAVLNGAKLAIDATHDNGPRKKDISRNSMEKNLMEKYRRNPDEILVQLELCDYECQGGPLVNNTAYRALIELVKTLDKKECD